MMELHYKNARGLETPQDLLTCYRALDLARCCQLGSDVFLDHIFFVYVPLCILHRNIKIQHLRPQSRQPLQSPVKSLANCANFESQKDVAEIGGPMSQKSHFTDGKGAKWQWGIVTSVSEKADCCIQLCWCLMPVQPLVTLGTRSQAI